MGVLVCVSENKDPLISLGIAVEEIQSLPDRRSSLTRRDNLNSSLNQGGFWQDVSRYF